MAKATEEKFGYYRPIPELKRFLEKKAEDISNKIARHDVKNPKKAEAFVVLINECLQLAHFEINGNVGFMVECLKEDYAFYKNEIVRINDTIKALDGKPTECEPEAKEGYIIPDEESEYLKKRKDILSELREEMSGYDILLNQIKREKTLYLRLLGMIARPNGFFKNI